MKTIMYSAFRKYSDPLTLSILLRYSLILKWITFHPHLHTIPHNDPLPSTLLKHLWQRLQFGRPVFGEFLLFFSADTLKPRQVGWRALLHSYVQVSPEMFDWVQVRALAGPLKDIRRLVPKLLLRCLDCVLRVIVLLEGELEPQSEVLSTLEQVFIKDLSVLCSIYLSLDPDYSSGPCR
jgi:hypothetical protein